MAYIYSCIAERNALSTVVPDFSGLSSASCLPCRHCSNLIILQAVVQIEPTAMNLLSKLHRCLKEA